MSIIPMSDLSQLELIDDLVEHFMSHHSNPASQDDHVKFFTFLFMHYTAEHNHEHEDDSQHENLPLKQLSSGTSYILSGSIVNLQPIIKLIAAYFSYYQLMICRLFSPSIDHPPAYSPKM
jgi:hypothetical protein